MKILHTENSLGWGGQEIRILSEIEGMRGRGHDMHLICPPSARICTEAAHRGIPVTALPIEKKRMRGMLALRAWLAAEPRPFSVVSIGQHIEIYKEVGLPIEVANAFKLKGLQGSHIIGHTRMATESAVTTAGSHPFSTGSDLCLVHNGSLSNHNRLRRKLEKAGAVFRTENDSEVAAQYLDVQMQQGATLSEALTHALADLDGFYTFTIGTSDGFAVLRDPIACKPAVMAETDDWVAMASEYRALACLPGVKGARLWEPEPATVYVWGGERAAAGH
jgi:glutamate synthase domain-containing protein 1